MNNLSGLGINKTDLKELLEKNGFSGNMRAEEFSNRVILYGNEER